MSGLLDTKLRVMDVILTLEGREQLSRGGVQVKFASFSDSSVYYRADVASGSQDASLRLAFEACNLPQDHVTFQSDEFGQLKAFANTSGVNVVSGRLLDYSLSSVTGSVMSGSVQSMDAVTGQDFVSSVDDLIDASVENFVNLRTLSTFDELFDDDGFVINNSDITFTLTDAGPISDQTLHTANVNDLGSIFSDPRLSHIPNFQYLPPLNQVPDGVALDKSDATQTSQYRLGDYAPWGSVLPGGLSKEQVEMELAHYEALQCVRTVRFDPTSLNNRIVVQVMESGASKLQKLDVIEHPVKNTPQRYFFVGKTVTNENNVDAFVHLFTMVFG